MRRSHGIRIPLPVVLAVALAVALAVPLLSTGSAAFQGAAGCERWTVDGYRLGMSVDEAEAVRPKTRVKGDRAAVKEKGVLKGKLFFDEDGRLASWQAEYLDTTFAEVRARLVEQLGEPDADDVFADTYEIGEIVRTGFLTRWTDSGCGATVLLRRDSVKSYATRVLQMDRQELYLVLIAPDRAGEIDWKDLR